jgi:hypothetical protein
MEAQVVRHLIALGKGYNGFFCPESRFHLMGGMKPQDYYPVGIPLSKAVKVGLRTGTLVDVNGTIDPNEYMNGPDTMRRVVTVQPVNAAAIVQAAQIQSAQVKADEGAKKDGGDGGKTDENAKKEGGDGGQVVDEGGSNDQSTQSDSDQNDTPQSGNELSLESEGLTEEQIDNASRKFLLEYIEKHQISKETLGLNSRSDAEEVKNALKIHFGYKAV